MEKGQRAPFSGQLLSDAATAQLLSEMRLQIKDLELKIRYLSDIHKLKIAGIEDSCTVKVATENEKLKSCLISYTKSKAVHDKALQRLNKELEKKNKTKWYQSPYFYFSVVAAVGVTSSMALIITSMK